MAAVASTTLGPPLLFVLAVGLAALALWQLGELRRLWRRAGANGGRRAAAMGTVQSVGKAAVYLGLAVLAIRFATATATGSPSSAGQQRATSGVFALPCGRLVVGAATLVVAGVGVRQWVTGLRDDFLEEVDTDGMPASHRRVVRWRGRVGFPAKGTALVVVWGGCSGGPRPGPTRPRPLASTAPSTRSSKPRSGGCCSPSSRWASGHSGCSPSCAPATRRGPEGCLRAPGTVGLGRVDVVPLL